LRIYHSLEELEEYPDRRRVVAIGVFDGVHRGHQLILKEAVASAQDRGDVATAVTFHPHPEAVLRPRMAPRVLTLLPRKAALIAALGVDELVVVKFDRDFARLSPEDFCRVVLSEHLGAGLVLVGENFRFGYKGSGSPSDLEAYGRTHGFVVRAVPLAWEGGEAISSTRIRALLKGGYVREAERLLGRPHRLEGVVVEGAHRGRTLSAPTANLAPDPEVAVPGHGVYITRTFLEGYGVHPSVTSVGTNPTFEVDRKLRVETLLLDFSGEVYGAHMAVDFLERLRSQQKFADVERLRRQIQHDVEIARGYWEARAYLLAEDVSGEGALL